MPVSEPDTTSDTPSDTVPGEAASAIHLRPPLRTGLPHKPPAARWWRLLFSFNGRIARRHFWLGQALIFIICWAWMKGIDVALENLFHPGAGDWAEDFGKFEIGNWAGQFRPFELPFLWPVLAVQVKRWHDRSRSGWALFVNLIPIVGWIWIFIECGCLRGTIGDNKYGPDPA